MSMMLNRIASPLITLLFVCGYTASSEALAAESARSPEIQMLNKMATPPNDSCNSGGGQNCNVEQRVTADVGFIVCNILGSTFGGKGADAHFYAENPLPDGPQNRPAYKTARVYGTAPSKNGPWEYWGSDVGYYGFGIVEISESATPNQRVDNGCQY